MRHINRTGWIVLIVWVIYWVHFSRYAMLDDALIHLRYASFLQKLHFVTYDGIHHTYGTSSILYLCLLASFRGFTKSALLPKYVSTACYLLLVALLSQFYRRRPRGVPSQLLWLGLLLTSLTPMAIRWLTDGMETSLVVLSTTLLAWFVSLGEDRSSTDLKSYLAALVFGALLTLLRIELVILSLLAVCILIATRVKQSEPRSPNKPVLIHSTALGVGAFLAVVAARLTFGSFLADTALAKSGGKATDTLFTAASAIGSSMTLGIGAAVLALASGLFLLLELTNKRSSKFEFIAWICANAAFPVILALACSRGQVVQGIRYILWTFYFATAWNTFTLSKLEGRDNLVRPAPRILTWGYAALILVLLPFDWHISRRVMAGRSHTFETMRSAHLDQFQGKQMIAADIGFIGYFTSADICDLAGLVNGRFVASLTKDERMDRCISRHPQLLFLDFGQTIELSRNLKLADWITCQKFDFTNVHSNDTHYLLVSPDDGVRDCPLGTLPVRAKQIIPALVN